MSPASYRTAPPRVGSADFTGRAGRLQIGAGTCWEACVRRPGRRPCPGRRRRGRRSGDGVVGLAVGPGDVADLACVDVARVALERAVGRRVAGGEGAGLEVLLGHVVDGWVRRLAQHQRVVGGGDRAAAGGDGDVLGRRLDGDGVLGGGSRRVGSWWREQRDARTSCSRHGMIGPCRRPTLPTYDEGWPCPPRPTTGRARGVRRRQRAPQRAPLPRASSTTRSGRSSTPSARATRRRRPGRAACSRWSST